MDVDDDVDVGVDVDVEVDVEAEVEVEVDVDANSAAASCTTHRDPWFLVIIPRCLITRPRLDGLLRLIRDSPLRPRLQVPRRGLLDRGDELHDAPRSCDDETEERGPHELDPHAQNQSLQVRDRRR